MKPRVWTVTVAAVMAIFFVILAGRRPAPKLYPGDRTEMRTCRWCNGTGIEQGGEHELENGAPLKAGGPCVGCRGEKQLRVILPGPNHPAWVKGTVIDPTLGDLVESSGPSRFRSVPGALKGAQLEWSNGSEKWETRVGLTGRYKILLAPGHYKVHVSFKDYKPYDGEVDVVAPTEPIWEEYAHLVTPDEQPPVDFQLTH